MWIAVLLSSNPVGELGRELFYLTAVDLRWPAALALGVAGLEAVELTFPVVGTVASIRPSVEVHTVLNLVQGGVLVAATFLVLRVLLRYTAGGLERRIKESVATLARLQGERRKRRRG